jgi:two-component system sensor histidine kinase/response regulator
LLLDSVALVHGHAFSKNIEVKILTMNHNCIVFGDANMISTILRNLLTNAIKFTKPTGQVLVTVNELDNQYEISISDSGIGIEKSKIAKLFGIDIITTTLGTNQEKGTGFGLVLCKEFVEKHNGKIWCISELNVGSEFKFTLPKVNGINGL